MVKILIIVLVVIVVIAVLAFLGGSNPLEAITSGCMGGFGCGAIILELVIMVGLFLLLVKFVLWIFS